MSKTGHNILLADDDLDDCVFFKDALEDINVEATLDIVNDGEELMNKLYSNSFLLPDLLFLDLNMPRKNGFECLEEIKSDKKLQKLPVIIYSTSLNMDVADLLYNKGAHYYIRKPGNYSELKKVIQRVLDIIDYSNYNQPPRDKFILSP